MLVPTTLQRVGLRPLAYVDRETLGSASSSNPEHPGSRGCTCAKGPATLNQVNDPTVSSTR